MQLPSADRLANTHADKFAALTTFSQPSPAAGLQRRAAAAGGERGAGALLCPRRGQAASPLANTWETPPADSDQPETHRYRKGRDGETGGSPRATAVWGKLRLLLYVQWERRRSGSMETGVSHQLGKERTAHYPSPRGPRAGSCEEKSARWRTAVRGSGKINCTES